MDPFIVRRKDSLPPPRQAEMGQPMSAVKVSCKVCGAQAARSELDGRWCHDADMIAVTLNGDEGFQARATWDHEAIPDLIETTATEVPHANS